ALDGMPGRQMAIDADLNAGIIDEREAQQRREEITAQADFFGAMDGASKFVRGDAIAGIIITVINIVGGFAIGAIEKGWSVNETAKVFTILTIGDGLTSQIPSFVISIAAALIVTRSGSKGSLGNEMTAQLTSRPVALVITAGFLILLGLTPLPTVPLLSIALLVGGAAFYMTRQKNAVAREHLAREAARARAAKPEAPPVEDLLKVDTMELEIGYGLVSLVDANQGGDLLDRIAAIRRQLAAEVGLVLPPVRIRDNMTLPPNAYRLRIRGNPIGEGETRPGMLLAMDSGIATGRITGEQTREPAFGLDAWWIEPGLKTRAETMNYTVVDPTSVLTTHIAELARTHAAELLTREEVSGLVDQLKARAPRLIEQTIPDVVSLGDLQKVLHGLLDERVPIRDLETILATLGDWAPKTKDHEILVEYVRNALRRTICSQVVVPADPGSGMGPRLVCVTLDPAFEDVIAGYIERTSMGTTLTMPATVANAVARCILSALEPVMGAGHQPVVIASPQVRAQVRQIVQPHLPNITVLGYNEVVPGIEVESMALVNMPREDAASVA
ncbi:MAG: FHIPEP family type III secretion protein, partial [Phycisphaerales bacterium]|nr:FHIPEP family type III secretion protein [Phycisphaerales bacterium]